MYRKNNNYQLFKIMIGLVRGDQSLVSLAPSKLMRQIV